MSTEINEVVEAVAVPTPSQKVYKFCLYAAGQLVAESEFDANVYNSTTRVNIIPLSKKIITDLQAVLGSQFDAPSSGLYVGKATDGTNKAYALARRFKLPAEVGEIFKYSLRLKDGEKENIIIERNFSVKNFNSAMLNHAEIIHTVQYWGEEINDLIKKADQNNMWEQYELVNHFNISYQDVRNLSPDRRNEMLRQIHSPLPAPTRVSVA